MMAHVAGQARDQATLFPEMLDEVIAADSEVRVIDAFVETLDLGSLGFSKVAAEATGRPPYDPGDLLKLYVYGYMNQVRSSRRLEREAGRNVEVFWLIGRLQPAFKTIADFRKDHAQAIIGHAAHSSVSAGSRSCLGRPCWLLMGARLPRWRAASR